MPSRMARSFARCVWIKPTANETYRSLQYTLPYRDATLNNASASMPYPGSRWRRASRFASAVAAQKRGRL